ncbi:MAG: hypothetical protein M3R63_17840 [Actinomycetota bacterium]|nr:hypothetical protein [Actinomycetota bacterium]
MVDDARRRESARAQAACSTRSTCSGGCRSTERKIPDRLGYPEAADTALAKARKLWQPTPPTLTAIWTVAPHA